MFVVATYSLSSDGKPYNTINIYYDYDTALSKYNEKIPNIENEEKYGISLELHYSDITDLRNVENYDSNNQYTISCSYEKEIDGVKYKCLVKYQDGSWKRPRGVHLHCLEKTDSLCLTSDMLLLYPPTRTYY